MMTLSLDAKTPQILVVDDEKTLRLVLSHAMHQESYQVIEASNGAECLAICQQQLPDLILMDAVMPIVDGFTCCVQLHLQFGERCPPVLMITALDDEKSVDLAFEVGAIDYVTKPIHWAVLRQRVKRVLQTRWAIAALHHKMEQEQQLLSQQQQLVAQLESANQTLLRLASLDGLTQIANRRGFDEYLEREWQRLARERASLSLILCDIDYFKRYNDTYGHQAGDECLKQVAKLLARSVRRPADLVSRYGGEEFAIILPNTTLIGAFQVAQTVQSELCQMSSLGDSSTVTLSFGIAGLIPTPDASLRLLIEAADQALYQAKRAGRNRIVLDSGDPSI
jgi:diguanylate cyclase (GGDEF)-like protein